MRDFKLDFDRPPFFELHAVNTGSHLDIEVAPIGRLPGVFGPRTEIGKGAPWPAGCTIPVVSDIATARRKSLGGFRHLFVISRQSAACETGERRGHRVGTRRWRAMWRNAVVRHRRSR